jgi:hypothetical protein
VQSISSFETVVFCCFFVGPISPHRQHRHRLCIVYFKGSRVFRSGEGVDVHLFSAVDQALLDWWYAFFLFDALFDAGDLLVQNSSVHP